MKKIFVVLSAILAAAYPIVSHYCAETKIGLLIKGLASVFFVATALTAFLPIKDKSARFRKYGITIIIGLAISLAADVAIDIQFIAGFAIFLVAQITYLVAFFSFGKPTKRTGILLAALFLPITAFELFAPVLDLGEMLIPILVYLLAICMMVAKAFDGFHFKSKCAKSVAIGAALFLASDFELQFGLFSGLTGRADFLVSLGNAVLYYAAQLVIACSLSEDVFKD